MIGRKRLTAWALLAGFGMVIGTAGTAAAQATPKAAAKAADGPTITFNDVTHDPEAPVGGNPKGKLTIVEFFDYNCPVCKRSNPMLEAVLKKNPDIRVAYKDWPIFGADSVYAARVVTASKWQGKYIAFHNALLDQPRHADPAVVKAVAEKVGVNWSRLQADLKTHGQTISALLARNARQADAIGLNGTPAFLIGHYLLSGAPKNIAGFEKVIADARKAERAAPNKGKM